MKIAILGAGTFGSAMAKHLSRLRHELTLEEVFGSEVIFVSVPSYAVVSALLKVRKDIKNQKIVICTKGFASEEKLISEAVKGEFPNDVFFLYGPTLAEELSNGELSAMVLAGGEGKEELKKEIESETLRIELSDDVIGVQVGAALKNVVTIFVGILEGAGYHENAQAFIFTRGVQEIKKIGVALGANPDTFLGLTCVGDLTLRSRNRRLGIELGKGRKIDEITAEMGYVPEGINALKNAKIMARKIGIKAPFIETVYAIIFEDMPTKEAIQKIV